MLLWRILERFVKFCKYASELIEKVSGQEGNRYSNASLEHMMKVGPKILYIILELLLTSWNRLNKLLARQKWCVCCVLKN